MRYISHLALVLAVAISFGAIASQSFAGTTTQYVDDTAITTKIKANIVSDAVLKGTDIDTTTTKGVVKLTGVVRSKNQETEVVKIANQVDGVKSVSDHLQVQPTSEE